MSNHINLQIPKHSYIFGFLQADGSFNKQSRNRGKVSIELKREDEKILKKCRK